MDHPGYLVVDVETNALPDYKRPADAEGQPRLASIAMLFVTAELVEESIYSTLVRPLGWSMQPDATAVNGLTDEMLHELGIPVDEVLRAYGAAIEAGRAVIAFNSRFDLKTLRGELRLAGMDDLFEQTPNWCTMRAANPLVKAVGKTGRPKFPRLEEACRHFGIEAADVHSALGDALACLELARALVAAGVPIDPQVHHASRLLPGGPSIVAASA